jgi:hypothetical protein
MYKRSCLGETAKLNHFTSTHTMPKNQKAKNSREAYRALKSADQTSTKLPKKQYYRQRAHANPFSDHALE